MSAGCSTTQSNAASRFVPSQRAQPVSEVEKKPHTAHSTTSRPAAASVSAKGPVTSPPRCMSQMAIRSALFGPMPGRRLSWTMRALSGRG